MSYRLEEEWAEEVKKKYIYFFYIIYIYVYFLIRMEVGKIMD
jgi:hypothetical protein